ncbi:DoxX family membrane protein [Streptomyces termitum]|nr:DoxX family membrane protein [Streptomyces termitum]
MSVDTRTPRPGFDDQPPLSMVKVDSDPAQVIVNHASFRVRLAPAPQPRLAAHAASLAGAGAARRRPVVWTGRAAPGASGLLQAVRDSSAAPGGAVSTLDPATQAIPRVDDTMPTPVVPAGAAPPILPPMRRAEGAYDDVYEMRPEPSYEETSRQDRRTGSDGVRQGYYPGRRMNLGVVLLPLRVFLGLISVYAGMGKLCDPVYFDGGERGSMVKWLTSLHPWPLAEPLRDFALQHPVGAGLTVAFLQVVVGVLTVLGLWQRAAAVVGALLSAALLLTVSWKSVPVYDSADIIYLAAWSPLIIAGAPVYSADGRLAGEAWRTLGPRADLAALRRRVLRRSTLFAAVVVGLTLLIGSVLGGAVRSTEMVTVPGPNDDPINHLPGRPLPTEPTRSRTPSESPQGRTEPTAAATTEKAREEDAGETGRPTETGTGAGSSPTEERPSATTGGGTGSRTPSQSRPEPPPSTSDSPSGTSGGSTSGGTSGSPAQESPSEPAGGEAPKNPIGGLLG